MPKYKIELKISKLNNKLPPSIYKDEKIEINERMMFKLLGLWEHIKAGK